MVASSLSMGRGYGLLVHLTRGHASPRWDMVRREDRDLLNMLLIIHAYFKPKMKVNCKKK